MDKGWAFFDTDSSDGVTFRHQGRDVQLEDGWEMLRFAKWHAIVAGENLEFWAAADATDVHVDGAVKDASTEVGLERSCFDQVFSENLRCGNVYPAGVHLCEFLAESKICSNVHRVLELGAGSGLPGLWTRSQGCEVVLTDRLAGSLELMRRSIEASSVSKLGSARVQHLHWEDRPDWLSDFDLVIASDVLYGPNMAMPFFVTADRALKPGGSLIFAYGHRVSFSGCVDEELDHEALPYATVESVLCASKGVGFELQTDLTPAAVESTQIFHFIKPSEALVVE